MSMKLGSLDSIFYKESKCVQNHHANFKRSIVKNNSVSHVAQNEIIGIVNL